MRGLGGREFFSPAGDDYKSFWDYMGSAMSGMISTYLGGGIADISTSFPVDRLVKVIEEGFK